jgi:hypothetical protein
MMKSAAKPLRYVLVLGAAAAIFWGLSDIQWSREQTRFFPETGHTLEADFLSFYNTHGSQEIIGYPITDSFIDPDTGFSIQYFENARIELIPAAKDGEVEARFSPIGEDLGGWQTPREEDYLQAIEDPGCAFYPATQHAVCHIFLKYFEAHGGPEIFGFPISEFMFEEDQVVQYFQRFRLDWDASAPESDQVRAAPIGRAHFELKGYDTELLRPRRPEVDYDNHAVNLRLESSVTSPVLSTTDTQRVFITVRDQNRNPIAGAAILLTVHFPDRDRVFVMPATDESGLSQIGINFENIPQGEEILLDFLVVHGDIQGTTRDSFRIW